MQTLDLHENFFTLFGLRKAFQLDRPALDKAYLALQSLYHPDRVAHLDEASKRTYLIAATHINTGYQTLRYAISRARYLLQLEGVDTEEETNTAMPTDFLMAQMQWRENIHMTHNTKNIEGLEKLHQILRAEMASLDETLRVVLDEQHDTAQAALLVRKYRFYEKLDEEIGDAIESLIF